MPFEQYSSGGSSSKWGGSTTKKKEENLDPYDTTKVDKSISNAQTRISDAGGNVNPDKRKWVEKQLNLPQGQNWFFDTLDVLGRPQQALYGAVDAYAKGDDVGKGAYAGAAGNQKIYGSDFMEDMGVKNKYAKAIGGFALDVVADPVNLVPGVAFAKAGKIAAAPIKGAYKGLESALPQLKTGREAVQNGLGKAFVPMYKWNETLTGMKDDFLKSAYTKTENAIRYMGENSLKAVSGAARSAGGLDTGTDVGRLMERNISQTPRQLSNDTKVIDAANQLIRGNKDLRQWALDGGISIGEVQGYMRHILSAEERVLRKGSKPSVVDRPMSGMNNPDKKLLNNRKYDMSVEDANALVGRKMFEPNAFFASAIGQKKLIEYGNAVKFRRDVLSNKDFAVPHVKGTQAPAGSVIINTNNYKFIHDPSKAHLADDIGGDYAVTPGVKQSLDRYNKLTTDEGINSMLKVYDTAQSTWKRLALFSVPYHLRNDIGAKFNNYVGGMNTAQIAKYTALADIDLLRTMKTGKETPLFNEFRQQGLNSSSQHAVDFARAGEDAEKAFEKLVKDQSKSKGRRVLDKINPLRAFKTSQELGSFIDQTNRFALYRWARESRRMTPEQAAAKVKEVQFDYTNLTPFEKEYATRGIPFYRWARNNIPFQLQQFAKDPRKYMNVNKLRTNFQNSMGLEDEDTANYMRENFFIPVTGDGEGKGSMFGANLPLSDLTKLSKPGKLALDSASTLLKTPIELISNRNLFFNNDIQKFEGEQKKYKIPESIYGMDIPGGGKELGGLPVKTSYGLEQLGGQPTRALSKMLGAQSISDKENASIKPTLGISSMLKKYDVNETNLRTKQAELRRLMEYMDYLEQEQGARPRSVSEIKKGK